MLNILLTRKGIILFIDIIPMVGKVREVLDQNLLYQFWIVDHNVGFVEQPETEELLVAVGFVEL